MKNNFHWVTIILFGITGWVFLTPINSNAQTPARVTVLSEPPGARIQLDSTWIGQTPLHDLTLPPGRHVIRAFPPYSGNWNIAAQTLTFQVHAKQDTTITFQFTPPVFVNTIPSQATVVLDSLTLGTTPIYLPFLRLKGRTLILNKTGYQSARVRVLSAEPILITLQRKEGFTERKRPPLLKIVPKDNRAAKFTLIATTLVTHWAAFLLKRQADFYYDKYQHTAEPDAILKYWDNTRKFDRYSDIALATSYISLSALIYLIIFK